MVHVTQHINVLNCRPNCSLRRAREVQIERITLIVSNLVSEYFFPVLDLVLNSWRSREAWTMSRLEWKAVTIAFPKANKLRVRFHRKRYIQSVSYMAVSWLLYIGPIQFKNNCRATNSWTVLAFQDMHHGHTEGYIFLQWSTQPWSDVWLEKCDLPWLNPCCCCIRTGFNLIHSSSRCEATLFK